MFCISGLLPKILSIEVVQVNSSVLFISYLPPLALEGIPILYYTIQLIPEGITANTTELEYSFSPSDPCTLHTVSIAAWNSIGMGAVTNVTNIVLYQSN